MTSPLRPLLLLVLLLRAPAAFAGAAEAEVLLRRGQVGPALREALATLQAMPADLRAHAVVIDVQAARGLGHAVEGAYRELAQANPEAAWAWVAWGRASATPEASLAAYERALAIDPGLGEAWIGKGDVLRGTRRLAEAEAAYRRGVEASPLNPEGWRGLGASLEGQGRAAEAVVACRQAMARLPEHPWGYLTCARMLPAEGAELLERGAVRVAVDPTLWHAVGRSRLDGADPGGAVEALEQAEALLPGQPELRFDLLVARAMVAGTLDAAGRRALERARTLTQADPKQALARLDALVPAYPSCHLPRVGRAQVQASLGAWEAAEIDLRAALDQAPEDVDVQASLGLLLLERGRSEEALPLLATASRARPLDVSLATAWGMALSQVQGAAVGAKALDAVAARFSYDPRPLVALVTVLRASGNREAALTVARRAAGDLPHPELLRLQAALALEAGLRDEAVASLEALAEATGLGRYQDAARRLAAGEDVVMP